MAAKDNFEYSNSILSSITDAAAVTPSDTVDLEKTTRSVYIGAEGNLRVILASGATVTYVSAHVGRHPIRASRILATGTTATAIVAEY